PRGPASRRPPTSCGEHRRKKAVVLPPSSSLVSCPWSVVRGPLQELPLPCAVTALFECLVVLGSGWSARVSEQRTTDNGPRTNQLLDNLRQDVGFAEDLDLLAVHLDLGAGILAEEHFVPLGDADRRPLAGVEQLPRPDRQDLAALRLLLGRIRQHNAAGRLLLGLDLPDHHPVLEGTNLELSHEIVSLRLRCLSLASV